jgi:phosphatidylinositol-3-phosphatase
MHNGQLAQSIPTGDKWLRDNLNNYYQWAKNNNSLLIVTFDENDDVDQYHGLTDPRVTPNPSDSNNYRRQLDLQNRIVTIFAGARIRPGHKPDAYPEGKGITHVNILRTIEAMYVWLA